MTPQQITETKTIAEFMGYEYHNDYPILFPEGYYQLDELIANKYLVQQFKYHTSWDWLMPVWEKFKNLDVNNEKEKVNHVDLKGAIRFKITERPIQEAFSAIANAIKWYNEIVK